MSEKSKLGLLLVVLIIPVLLFIIFIVGDKDPSSLLPEGQGKETIHIERTPIAITVAQTEKERMLGLGGKTSLPDNEGLFFIFPESSRHGIWMKEMRFPIDIIWIGSSMRIVDITENALSNSFPDIFYPRRNALYVLEVNAFFVESHGIQIGDEVRIPQRILDI